jgi:hypothetical protein
MVGSGNWEKQADYEAQFRFKNAEGKNENPNILGVAPNP